MNADLLAQASALYKNGDKSAAVVLLKQVLSEDPSCEVAWYGLAKCLQDPKIKRLCYERMLAINPSSQRAWLGLESLKAEEQDARQARKSGHSTVFVLGLALLALAALIIAGVMLHFGTAVGIAAGVLVLSLLLGRLLQSL